MAVAVVDDPLDMVMSTFQEDYLEEADVHLRDCYAS